MARKNVERKMIKVVYFDEQSACDYVDITNGGRLDWSTAEDKEKIAKIIAEIDAEISGGFNFFSWLKASMTGKVSSEYNKGTKTAIETKITNTILTDFLSATTMDRNISKFNGLVYAPDNSISLYKMYSPYTIIMPKSEMPIDLERLNEALENARGYYEMLLEHKDKQTVILRFNAKAFRNNYNLSDLTKMNLTYYAVEVGVCDATKLDMSKEFDFSKKLPTAEEVLGVKGDAVTTDGVYKVYDVILAGTER